MRMFKSLVSVTGHYYFRTIGRYIFTALLFSGDMACRLKLKSGENVPPYNVTFSAAIMRSKNRRDEKNPNDIVLTTKSMSPNNP